jgi:hypothetical protein
MTPHYQLGSSLSIQCCLLDPYGRLKVVGSCLLCPCGCWWPQKLCWPLGSITDFWPKFCWKTTPHDTTEPMRLFLVHAMLFVGSIWKNKSGWFLFVTSVTLKIHMYRSDTKSRESNIGGNVMIHLICGVRRSHFYGVWLRYYSRSNTIFYYVWLCLIKRCSTDHCLCPTPWPMLLSRHLVSQAILKTETTHS